MGAVYKSICFEADTLQLLAIRLAEKELEVKLNIEKLMNDGFVNIAKARYIMGSTCVTKMQLPTGDSNPIKPLVTVFRREVDNSWVFYIVRENFAKKDEFMGEGNCEVTEGDCISDSGSSISSLGKSEAAFRTLLQTDPKSLKTAKQAFLVEDDLYQIYNDELLDEISNSDSNESLVSVIDPIRLFGILVPNVLKQAQVVFNDVVNLLAECATVQLKLKETLDKFNHLSKVKRLIEAASVDTKCDILTPRVYWTPSESSSISCHSFRPQEEYGEGGSDVSSLLGVQKSVRSVFYDVKDEPGESDLSLWASTGVEQEGSDN